MASDAALEAAEIDANTTLDGGEVQLLANGKPSGILIDIAGDAIKSLIPPLTLSEKRKLDGSSGCLLCCWSFGRY